MKRLVAYADSDDEEPPKKRKKLPALAPSVVLPVHIDNPGLHQGRIRSTLHVDGQWASHIYVCLKLDKSSPLVRLIEDVLSFTRERVPTVCKILSDDQIELHVSLSRPVFVRSHQRDDLKRAVKSCAQQSSPFTISLASFAEFTNDEKTRAFLAMEVGAGHHELKSLSDALTPTLQIFRQKEYYSLPRFHASIAWALLASGDPKFEAIPRFPEDLVPALNKHFGDRLVQKSVGWFEAQNITLKIGKDVFSWQLKVQ